MRPRCPCSFPDELHYVAQIPDLVWLLVADVVNLNQCMGCSSAASQIEYEVIVESTCDVDLIVTDGYQFPLLIRGPSRFIDGPELNQGARLRT